MFTVTMTAADYDAMKCCANCGHGKEKDMEIFCTKDDEFTPPRYKCSGWKPMA